MQYLEIEKDRIDKVQELAQQQQQLVQDSAALAEAQRHSHTLAVEFKSSRLAELASAETRHRWRAKWLRLATVPSVKR